MHTGVYAQMRVHNSVNMCTRKCAYTHRHGVQTNPITTFSTSVQWPVMRCSDKRLRVHDPAIHDSFRHLCVTTRVRQYRDMFSVEERLRICAYRLRMRICADNQSSSIRKRPPTLDQLIDSGVGRLRVWHPQYARTTAPTKTPLSDPHERV